MDLKIFLLATIVAYQRTAKIQGSSVYHSRKHQCIPPLVRTYEPIVYKVAGCGICAMKCSQNSCLFFEFSETDGCKIYGVGMESTSIYVNTDVAAPPAGGPLQEMAKGKPAHPTVTMKPASRAVDDDYQTFWEKGWVQPWWMVDLGAYYFIHYVNILPRQGYFAYRFQDVEVRAGPDLTEDGDLSLWELVGLYPSVYQSGGGQVHFNTSQGVCGRFLSVQRISDLDDTLALSDVEVYVRERKPY